MRKMVAFSIPEELIKEFNKIAKDKCLNKSLYIQQCLREYIKKNKSDDKKM